MPDLAGKSIDSHGLSRPRHQAAADLATDQGGPISREQLKRLGFSRGAIEYGLRSGRLHSYLRGVYLLGHEALTPKGRMMGAVLEYGDEAALSHRSGSTWWEILRSARTKVDVTVPARARRAQTGIDLHLVRRLDARDVTVHKGVPLTTVPRTLLDLAEVVPRRQLKAAIETADRRGLFDGRAVEELLARSPGRHVCVERELPVPTMNVPILGYTVDARWPGTNLIVELDSRAFHLNAKHLRKTASGTQRSCLLAIARCV